MITLYLNLKNNDRTDITAYFILTSVRILKVHPILYCHLNFQTIKCSSGHNSFDNGCWISCYNSSNIKRESTNFQWNKLDCPRPTQNLHRPSCRHVQILNCEKITAPAPWETFFLNGLFKRFKYTVLKLNLEPENSIIIIDW